MKRILDLIVLPPEVTPFERRYLERVSKVALGFLWVHLPVMMVIAHFCHTGSLLAGQLTVVCLAGPTFAAIAMRDRPRTVTRIIAFASVCLAGLLVHFGQGPMQIEMHFHFFVLIALLAVFADPLVIVVAALTVIAHHGIMFFALPASVFNYQASIWAVVVHAAFVVIESVAMCFVSRSFFDNVLGLEKIVDARTSELETRNAQMRVVLDSVEEGLMTVRRDGSLASDGSRALAGWLGVPDRTKKIWTYIGESDPKAGEWLELAWEMFAAGSLPPEVAITQFPARLEVGERRFAISYRLLDCETDEAVMIVVDDITDELELEREAEDQRETVALFERAVSDRRGLEEFALESEVLVAQVVGARTTGLESKLRSIHTLKGICGLIGARSLASACHAVESSVAEKSELTRDDERALDTEWRRLDAKLGALVKQQGRSTVEVGESDLRDLLAQVKDGGSIARIEELVGEWSCEPMRLRLERLADDARTIARRLDKPVPTVRIEDGGVRLSREGWTPFWSGFVHLLRNAVDHGLETAEERRQSGKPEGACIALRTLATADGFVVEIEDDGRGIPWDRIRERAAELDLPHETHDDLVRVLFTDGVTTKEEASELSGRGVGMAAVLAQATRLGGTCQVVSKPGRGTTITFTFPLSAMRSTSATTPSTRPSNRPHSWHRQRTGNAA
jgi:two-component system, chemotaxis family, sensor kinase CheA